MDSYFLIPCWAHDQHKLYGWPHDQPHDPRPVKIGWLYVYFGGGRVNGSLALLWPKDWTHKAIPPYVNLPLIGNYWWTIVWLRITFWVVDPFNLSCWMVVEMIPHGKSIFPFQSNPDCKSICFNLSVCHPQYNRDQLEPNYQSIWYFIIQFIATSCW